MEIIRKLHGCEVLIEGHYLASQGLACIAFCSLVNTIKVMSCWSFNIHFSWTGNKLLSG